MKVALASDHRGDAAGANLADTLRAAGHEVLVLGDTGSQSRDYPVSAWLVGQAIASGAAELGVLLCGSGNGIAIAANKIPSVRAAIGYSDHAAEMARVHNNANVICIAADDADDDQVFNRVDAFLAAKFEGGRHARRVSQIDAIERGEDPSRETVTA